jgi:hypothetical protein
MNPWRINNEEDASALEPGGILLQVECRRTWPTTRVDDRYYFQMGALGGATPEEFFHGSERVEAYLERYESHRRRWDPPAPDSETPEAEWGFIDASSGHYPVDWLGRPGEAWERLQPPPRAAGESPRERRARQAVT